MAKEMIIIFVYDTQLKREADDLSSAILYFHPHWVSDQQRTALCGQIMGTFHCLKSIFTSPSIISLQSGKFFIIEYGRYILAIGTDRNIDDWVLEYRAETMSSLIQLFHNNLEVMANNCPNDIFQTKLYHMLETYLKILIYSGNIFCNIPTLQLPKSASNVFLEAIEILQTCQGTGYVLGGTILYHNKVVATQLKSTLTKKLVLTDPYRIKSPAETINVNYQLPLGVQLMKIYIQEKEYEDLLNDSDGCRNINQYFKSKSYTKKTPSTKEAVISAMKRDQSLIFTTVPEEENENQSPVKIENITIQSKPLSRPKFLNLRNKTTDVRTTETTEPKTVPITPFRGQTSVCSTPMTDLNKVLHQKVMSICINPHENDNEENDTNIDNTVKESKNIPKTESLNSVLSAISETSDSSIQNKDFLLKSVPYMKIALNISFKTYKSSWDLTDLNISPKKRNKRLKSICDPTFPVLSINEKCISKHLYNIYVKEHIKNLNNEAVENHVSETNTEEWKSLEDIDSDLTTNNKNKSKNINDITNDTFNKASQEQRRSLTLPLKSFNENDSLTSPGFRSSRSFGGVQLTPLMSKLSLLANEERSSGFCSIVTTPSEYKDYIKSTFNAKNNIKTSDIEPNRFRTNCNLRKTALFVCGQQDMVVILIMEEEGCFDRAIITKLWENCIEYLCKIEKQLRQCLEMYPTNSQNGNVESYSYLCMDSDWDTVQRGGPWGAMELGSLTHMHRDFCDNNLTEIILRDDEGVIYGHQLGKNEVYYHQTVSNSHSGLPTPADPMGTVPLKAKRRLERDHAIILL